MPRISELSLIKLAVASILAVAVLGALVPGANAAKTTIRSMTFYDGTARQGFGYEIRGGITSPRRACAEARRMVIVTNLRSGKRLDRTRTLEGPQRSSWLYASTKPKKGLIKVGDKVKFRVTARKVKNANGAQITCAAAKRVFRVKELLFY